MKLETLTSLHIGSGNMLQKDSDFVFGKDAKEQSVVYVINPRKVLALIGEENVDAWTVAIENGRSTEDIVKLYAPKATITDYSLHTIDMKMSRPAQQIKEFIRDGFDRPHFLRLLHRRHRRHSCHKRTLARNRGGSHNFYPPLCGTFRQISHLEKSDQNRRRIPQE